MKSILINFLLITILIACSGRDPEPDAVGTFEAVETIIPAEASGVIKEFSVEEGQFLQKDQIVGYIDTVQLYLRMKQLQAQIKSTVSQKPDINRQIASLQTQLKVAKREKARIENLLKADAATGKQLDDVNAQVEILKQQLEAQQSSLDITTKGISLQADPISIQIEQLKDQLDKSKIQNPINGTVLSKYSEANEMATIGKPLYKIADLRTIILRAYITNEVLSTIKLNQQVKVLVDAEEGKYRQYDGIIEWINNKAEFTPKTIQTKDERANLVYAVKIRVKNDGLLKIGMYGEVKL